MVQQGISTLPARASPRSLVAVIGRNILARAVSLALPYYLLFLEWCWWLVASPVVVKERERANDVNDI